MNNPTCAACLQTIESPKGATVGMFFDKTQHKIEAYCLCGKCVDELRSSVPEKQAVLVGLIERNFQVEGVTLDPNKQLFVEGE